MKIAYFCVNIGRGGLERLLLQICSEFKANYPDIQTEVVVFKQSESDLLPEFKKHDVPVQFLNINDSNFGLPEFKLILNWLKKNKPDIVHTHSGYRMDMFILLAAFLAGIRKRICTIHNMDQQFSIKSRISYKVSSFLSTNIIAVSQSAKSYYEEKNFYSPKKLKVIYNCPGFLAEDVSARNTGPSAESLIKLVNIGSLRVQKGQIYLIRAAKILQSAGINFQLEIYGSNSFGYGDQIFDEISSLNLSMIHYRGETSNVGEILKNSDVLIAASIREAMPLVVLEGISAGIPIVATDIHPHREILHPIEGSILVTPKDDKAIAHGIIRLIKDKELYIKYSEEAIKRSKDFSLKKTVSSHYDLYQKQ